MSKTEDITVQIEVNAPVEVVWKYWNTPEDIMIWNTASDDWKTTNAENELKVGGEFNYHMEAKDGSIGFDFWGIYTTIKINELIEITLGDDRKMSVHFSKDGDKTYVKEVFEAKLKILLNFKKTVGKLYWIISKNIPKVSYCDSSDITLPFGLIIKLMLPNYTLPLYEIFRIKFICSLC